MALDPELVPLVQHLYGVTFEQLTGGEVAARRPRTEPVAGVTAEDRVFDGPHGEVAVRCYRPVEPATAPLPALVWSHGGGWMFGDLDMPEADAVSRRAAAWLPGVVVSVRYRLAPRHHFPVPRDDVMAVFEGVRQESDQLGVDPERIILGGASAGAHLTACAALALRDAGGARPAGLLLAYPATDPILGPYPDQRPNECPETMWLDGPIVAGLFAVLVGESAGEGTAVPAAAELGGLPPTLITTAHYDALAPQAHRFVEQLRGAGVDVVHHEEPGLLHGYLNMVGELPAADAALGRYVDWVRHRTSANSR